MLHFCESRPTAGTPFKTPSVFPSPICMNIRRNLIAARRNEPDLRASWGIYCVHEDRWLPIFYRTRRETEEAIKILQTG